jgi:hypothetical protein
LKEDDVAANNYPRLSPQQIAARWDHVVGIINAETRASSGADPLSTTPSATFVKARGDGLDADHARAAARLELRPGAADRGTLSHNWDEAIAKLNAEMPR